jgi:hypothetical protein
MAAAVTPLPTELTTPPVQKIYFGFDIVSPHPIFDALAFNGMDDLGILNTNVALTKNSARPCGPPMATQ